MHFIMMAKINFGYHYQKSCDVVKKIYYQSDCQKNEINDKCKFLIKRNGSYYNCIFGKDMDDEEDEHNPNCIKVCILLYTLYR